MGDEDTGSKWWIKNVVVPVLAVVLGGGGITALYISQREHPSEFTPSYGELFVMDGNNRMEDQIFAKEGESLVIHWEVLKPQGPVYLQMNNTLKNRRVFLTRVASQGSDIFEFVSPRDFVLLEERDGKTAMIATFRVDIMPSTGK